ncbi:MAG: isoleucine--tRNA ligase [Chloroflexota bacterium]
MGFQRVDSKVSFPELERQILDFWKRERVFERSLELRAGGPTYILYEGPPTANGLPGIHHVLARVFKDIMPRFKTMRGYYAPRIGGWDTHGLPVELEVEKELGITTKPEIEAYGIDKFNARCRESVMRYVREWEELTDRIAFWIDMKNAYITFENRYIESCWWAIKELWNRGLVYQDYKVTPHCPRCVTSLSSHEVALGYDTADDPSLWVKFPLVADSLPAALKPFADRPVYILAWTTTPWTLPANLALAVNPDADYALVEVESGERMVLARALLGKSLTGAYRELAAVKGRELVGVRYEPLYRPVPLDRPAHRVVAADFVSLEEGTGVVHIAPAYGEDDLELGRRENLPVVHTVDLQGRVRTDLPLSFAGRFFKDADPLIIQDLAGRGLVYRSERYVHTYPFCWRCETPLLYYAKTSWYFRTTAFKGRMVELNGQINWVPEHIKEGRFGDWLRNNVDWAISRERYWGTPIPIWVCEGCDHRECIGSVAELSARAGRDLRELDLHRPYVDEVTFECFRCGGVMRRVPEVMDVWFDSGAMPFAQWHYPFENQEVFRTRFPADYICEAVDQTRGWFYSLHALATMLFDSIAYRNVVCLGLVLDAKGEKMSKSRGNVVDPWEVIGAYGADPLRWYLFTATAPGNARRFDPKQVEEGIRRFFLTLWNTYAFFVTYASLDGFDPTITPRPTEADLTELDRWVLSELNLLIKTVTDELEAYNPTDAGRAIEAFVDKLSNWYVRRNRRRFWKSEQDADKRAAHWTLYTVLTTLTQLLAPFTPFVAEAMYQNLVRGVDPDARLSVHLTDWPEADLSRVDQELMAAADLIMRLASLGRAARDRARLKVRQPVSRLFVKVRFPEEVRLVRRLADHLLEELNAKELVLLEDEAALVEYRVKPRFDLLGPRLGAELPRLTRALAGRDPRQVVAELRTAGRVVLDGLEVSAEELAVEVVPKAGYAAAEEAGYLVGISTEVTPDLAAEGLARELVRRIQTLRKEAGLELSDRVVVYYEGDPEVEAVFASHGDYIAAETLAVRLHKGPTPPSARGAEVRLNGRLVRLGVERTG